MSHKANKTLCEHYQGDKFRLEPPATKIIQSALLAKRGLFALVGERKPKAERRESSHMLVKMK